jgi:hypothetical protein
MDLKLERSWTLLMSKALTFGISDLNDLDLWNIRPPSGAPGASLHPCVKFGEDRAIFEDFTFLTLMTLTFGKSDPSGTPGASLYPVPWSLAKIGPFEDLTFDLNDLDLWKIRPPVALLGWAYTCVWSLVKIGPFLRIWPFDLNLWKIRPPSGIPGASLHPYVKFGEDWAIGLGGVGEETNKQTNRQTDKRCSNYSMIPVSNLGAKGLIQPSPIQ